MIQTAFSNRFCKQNAAPVSVAESFLTKKFEQIFLTNPFAFGTSEGGKQNPIFQTALATTVCSGKTYQKRTPELQPGHLLSNCFKQACTNEVML